MIPIDLAGKTALVTGATGQLGRTIARTLAKAGADVAVHYHKNREAAERLAAELRDVGVRSIAVPADVTDSASVFQMRDDVFARLGPVQIVVAGAVIQYEWKSVLEQDVEDYESQFRSCVLHNVNLAKAFVPAMQEAGWGRYIGLNSECGVRLLPGESAYGSGKRGMDAVLRVLAKEAGPFGVTVNQVAPGWMVSDRWRDNPEDDSAYAANVPLRRRGDDADIAHAVAFLASDLAGFITGAFLPVCGGNVMPGI